MRRILTFGLAWLAAAVTASAVAWQGVNLIEAQVTDSRPETLSASEIDTELAEATAASGGQTADGGTTTTPTDANGTATTAPPTTSTTELRVVPLTGGTAAFEFSDGSVALRYARPNPGYGVETDDRDNGGIRVEFEGDEGTSRVEAWWDGGPQVRGDENGHGGDDD